jgi:hypothetical protein
VRVADQTGYGVFFVGDDRFRQKAPEWNVSEFHLRKDTFFSGFGGEACELIARACGRGFRE